MFPTKAEAIAAVQRLQARGVRSIDGGCLQINLMVHPNAVASLNAAFAPSANGLCAARFPGELRAGTHNSPQAVADDRAQAPLRGKAYRDRVSALARSGAVGLGPDLARACQDFIPSRRICAECTVSSRVYAPFTTSQPALAYTPHADAPRRCRGRGDAIRLRRPSYPPAARLLLAAKPA